MLERTRRTVKRALRNTPPDSFERNQPRWRLPAIIQALQSSDAPMIQSRHSSGVGTGNVFDDLDADLAHDRYTLPLFNNFNRSYAKMKAERSLAKRREIAISFAPKIIDACISAYRAHCVASGEFIDGSTRADCMFSRLMDSFEEPCHWTQNEVWNNLVVWGEDDEA